MIRLRRLFNIYGEGKGTGYAGNVWDIDGTSPALTTMGGEFLDCYNKTVHDDIATTIKTNVITSCNYFIYEESEQ